MRMLFILPIMLAALVWMIGAPNISLGQDKKADQVSTKPRPKARQQPVRKNPDTGRPRSPSPVGGVAKVIGVDEPEKCLRIRNGPGKLYEPIGCAKPGEELKLTGVWTSNNWAQLESKGWVYGPQIKTDIRPPKEAYSQPGKYLSVEGLYPKYDSGYLPDYGYTSYGRSETPIILYDVNVWHKYHPWWWGKNQLWDPTKKEWVNIQPPSVQSGVKKGPKPDTGATKPPPKPSVLGQPKKPVHKLKGKPRRFIGSATTGFGASGSHIRFGSSNDPNKEK